MKANKRILFLAQFSMLLAIQMIVCFTPLGSIPIGPMVATLAGVPVIITAIMLGTKAGALMGFFTGLFSFLVMTFTPPSPVAFVFTPFYSIGEAKGNLWSLVICFVPRILIGVVAGIVFQSLSKALKGKKSAKVIPYAISGIFGSMTATILVLGGIYVFFGQAYAATLGMSYELLLGALGITIATNGLLEAAICAIAATAICYPLRRYSTAALAAEAT
ncbi:MAG: ECF transporter S component [Clostridium sp.]|uniref:ECF transporter S component n=1 Tax=Clostridium sp. TaxID=1506 RepID=UPI0029145BB3|nr:ECF transporter S component [Clostridium sp.]MDU7337311.1 ECF transporter S component [Clostridium sp.]